MSGTQQPGTPAPRTGTTVAQAAASIEALLDREGDNPEPTRRPSVPRRDPPPRAETDAAPPTSETEPRETLSEADDGEIDDVILPDDAEEEGSEEDTVEAEDAEDDQQPKQRMVTVKIDGKPVQLPEDEVANGYLRQTDYTKKTMAHAEERKAFAAEVNALRTERAQYAELLPVLHGQVNQLRGHIGEPDPALLNTDPVEYMRQRAVYDDLVKREEASKVEGLRLWQLSEQERKRERAELLVRERELIKERVPAWADDNRWKQVASTARKYAEELGYSEEQIREVTDHRAVMVLWQAARYAQLAKQGNAVPNPPRREASPSPEPGPHPTRRRLSAHTQNKQRLAKSHSLADAAAVLRGLL
jgi:hypothetical protein